MTHATLSPQPAQETLFALVYQELRRIARGQRRISGAPMTLDTTGLVHEVYLKLHAAPEIESIDRVHFLSLATRAMRQILVDNARSRGRIKHGAEYRAITLRSDAGLTGDTVDLVALDDLLERLARIDPRAAELVEWRAFGGLEFAEIAQLQGLTERSVFRAWRRARAFLIRELNLVDKARA
ncbi:MAG: ECF-type sigma factor [Rudaea sp.]|uniref:ECF-type sigma factor n=1 Tax=Rudaea sp. TaxID=2136325 RepID=UPI0039E53A6C